MYSITDAQVDYILNDIRRNGVEMEDLQLNLLDHICCIIEQELKDPDDFERFYQQTIKQFYKSSLGEIEEETINLLTFKNFYQMKKFMIISGTFSAAAFVLGSLFKAMHWPGAGVLICSAIFIFTFVFLPLLYVLKNRETKTTRDKWILGLGIITGVLYCSAVLFTIQHWPGSRILWFTTVCVSMFAFIPLYFFTDMSRPEAKFNTTVTTVLFVGATGLLFTMLRVSDPLPIQAYMYIKNEQLLKNIQQQQTNVNTNKLAEKINITCEELKRSIITSSTSQPGDYLHGNPEIPEKNIQGIFGMGKNLELLQQLKTAVNEYNVKSTSGKIPTDHSVLDASQKEMGQYTNINMLNNIVQVQLFLATAKQDTGAAVALSR